MIRSTAEDGDDRGIRGCVCPKVLILSLNRVNAADAGSNSLLLKNLFRNWPRDRIAQVYSGGSNGDAGHWKCYYELKESDRRFGKIFFSVKRKEMESRGQRAEALEGNLSRSLGQRVRACARMLLLQAGLYELVFSVRMSMGMRAFIREFGPDLIFAQGYSLGFARLPVAVQRLTGARVCFHTSDDWPATLYKGECLSWLMRPLVHHAAQTLIGTASVCFGFSPTMCQVYERRYGKTFHVLMNGDCYERFKKARPVPKGNPRAVRIVYAGSVGHGRWQSLVDLCDATADLREEGYDIELYAYVLHLAAEVAERFRGYAHLHLPEHPRHEELPAHLKAADILFLPESFEAEEARRIELSISTKAQLYMMSERPILVYAHPLTGVAQYAAAERWAMVLDRRDRARLREAVRRLASDQSLREGLVARGKEVAMKNHDLRVITEGFEERVRALCAPLAHVT